MWLVTIRDLQWRLRRFLIAGLGAALVFAMTLVLAGLSSSFADEAERTVDAVRADAWVLPTGVQGPFNTVSPMPVTTAQQVAALPGVQAADPLLILNATAVRGQGVQDVNVIGYRPGGIGGPRTVAGRLPRAAGELVADESIGAALGSALELRDHRFTVVGHTRGMTVNGGQPVLYLPIAAAQQALTGGLAVASAVVTRGVPATVPPQLAVRSSERTAQDLLRPLQSAIRSLELAQLLLWVVAALVVGSVIYLSALERARDFAVFKATGWSSRSLGGGLALQAVLLSTGASVIGVAVAHGLVPVFPMRFDIPLRAALLLPVMGALVGLLACGAGLQRALGVDPALAFGGS